MNDNHPHRNDKLLASNIYIPIFITWRHYERDSVSNHRRLDYLLNRPTRRRSNKTSKLRVTGLCERNSPVTGEFPIGEFPTQMAINMENVSIWWRHHAYILL